MHIIIIIKKLLHLTWTVDWFTKTLKRVIKMQFRNAYFRSLVHSSRNFKGQTWLGHFWKFIKKVFVNRSSEQSLIIWEESCNMCLVTINNFNLWAFIRVVTALPVYSFLLSVVNWLTSAVCEGHNFATKNSLQGVPSASRQDRKVGTQLNFGLDW